MSFYLGYFKPLSKENIEFHEEIQTMKPIYNKAVLQYASNIHTHFFLCSDRYLYSFYYGRFSKVGSLQFQSIKTGGSFFLGKTIDNKLASCGSNHNGQLGSSGLDFSIPQIIKNSKFSDVRDYACGFSHAWVLLKNKELIGFGKNSSGQLGAGSTESVNDPTVFYEDVERIFANHGYGTMLQKTNGTIYCLGANDAGMLSTSQEGNVKYLNEVIVPKNTMMKDIIVGRQHSLYLSDKGKLYGSGEATEILMNQNCKKFEEIPFFQDKVIIQIYSTHRNSLAISELGKIYLWGGFASKVYSKKNSSELSKTLRPYCFKNLAQGNWDIYFGYFSEIFIAERNDIGTDFVKLFRSGLLTDSKLQDIPFYRSFLELRIGKNINEIQSILNTNSIPRDQIEILLRWAYSDQGSNNFKLKKILRLLGIQDLTKNTLLIFLKKLYKDDDSKDFKLLVFDDDDIDENQEDLQKQEEANFEEIFVHKIILAARCGLFREMFKSLNQEINKVKDYSKKSPGTLKIFIKFLYTDRIELTADDDPELVLEELSDCKEYYQLSENSIINFEINKLKIQYGLK
ncbi:rcc1 and btb domain-containing protein [Anaeramoeba flamelloides]|uniref:Rcc1 and btb domain-containing protein n=1 Tax=Anaeramoeba flamelloides TaxID=1746091 RepID=A0AAV7Z3M2_9EUKA|nr:rcc1 and btb domain-containing protein [Anaeramoeba flamelloides]